MDRDTLEDDLDLVLGPQPSGEWDWEPRLGVGVPTTPAAEPESDGPEESEGPDAEAATDPVDEDDEDD